MSNTVHGLSEHQRKVLTSFALIGVIVISCIPLLSRTLLWGADLQFHLFRIEGITQGLKDGQFPVRMQSTQVAGYGYPVSVMYGDALLYIPAILRLMGVPLVMAYCTFAIAVNVVTVLSTYAVFRRIFQSRQIGILSAALWTLSTYRLDDVYSRGAVGEYIALLFLPLLLLGVFSIVFPKRQGASKHGGLICAIAAAGIITSHVISVELTIIALIPVLFWAILRCWRSLLFWKQLAIACVMSVGLSFFFLVPLLDYSSQGNLQVYNQTLQSQVELLSRKAIELGQLLTLFLPLDQMTEGHAFQGDIPYSVGWALIMCALLLPLIYLCEKGKRGKLRAGISGAGIAAGLGALLCLFMATTLFPWSSERFASCFKFLYSIQFPTRLLAFGCFLLVVVGALGLQKLQRSAQFGNISIALFVVIFSLACLEGGVTTSTFMYNAKAEASFSSLLETSSGVSGGEYLIQGTDLNQVFPDGYKAGQPDSTSGIHVSDYQKQGTSVTLSVNADSQGTVTLPLFAYSNYQLSATPANGAVRLGTTGGSTNLLTISVPNGFSGEIHVQYRVPVLWRVAEALSLLCWVGAGISFLRKSGRNNGGRRLGRDAADVTAVAAADAKEE